MSKHKWFEQSAVFGLRRAITKWLEQEKQLPTSKDKKEKAATFWARVERAGKLSDALEMYDVLAERNAEMVSRPRETKKAFAERIEREGRQAEVEEARAELLEDGYSHRETHAKLVQRFQPLDGSKTRAWKTPDPWEAGRLFRKKEDQDKLLAEPEPDNNDYKYSRAKWRYEAEQKAKERRLASENAKHLVECAQWRREERVALANARRRARELEEAAVNAKASEAAKGVQPIG